MSYAKLPFGTTDWSSGFQSINQIYENYRSTYAGFGAEHGAEGATVFGGSNLDFLGHHNTPKVPRAVVRTALTTSAFNVTTIGLIEAYPVVTGMGRALTGLYFIALQDLRQFYGVAEAAVTSSTPNRVVVARTMLAGSGSPPGIWLECYEVSGGALALTDYDVCCAIYGTR